MPTEPAALHFRARIGNSYPRHLVWALLAILLLSPAFIIAQGRGNANPEPGEERENRGPGGFSQQRPVPGGIFKRLRELPPMQQRYVMTHNPQFLGLPPMRQELIRERLREWNAMTPQQKERVREREEILEGLSPAQRQEARNVFPLWRDLTPPRRQAVMVAFRHLRDLPPGQRRSFLDSQQVREEFSPHERDILEGLNKLLPARNLKPAESPDE